MEASKPAQPPPESTSKHIEVGNIHDSKAIAIGLGATAVYNQPPDPKEIAAHVVALTSQTKSKVWDGRIPYLGLTAFRESDAEFFFGRENLVDDLLARVQQSHFIVIAGPSGSGKSSVANAGLMHALRENRIERSNTWLLLHMQPKGNPINQLAAAVARAAKAPLAGDFILEHSQTNPTALHRQLETLLSDDPQQRCVLLVDQFEEIFTQTKDEEIRSTFINLLTTAAQTKESRTIIVLALRSDFVSHCARYPELRALMSQQFQLVGAMESRDLTKAITLPALAVGAKIDPELVSRIVTDMQGEPGVLPLMSFALRDLFEAEKTKKGEPMGLTLAEYIQRGGIESALERHANTVFDTFSAEQKALARGIFPKFIEIGQGRMDTRRTATIAELIPADSSLEAVMAVITALAQEGTQLIVTDSVNGDAAPDAANTNEFRATLAHEKLIDAWPWLRRLVDENREMIALQNQINNDAQAWAKEEDTGFLYRGGRLLQVEEHLDLLQPYLNALSKRFIEASLGLRTTEEEEEEAARQRELDTALALAQAEHEAAEEARRREKNTRRALLVIGGLAAVAIGIIVFAFSQRAQRQTAVRQQRANVLAETAVFFASNTDPELGLLLAVESYRLSPTSAAHAVMRSQIDAADTLATPVRLPDATFLSSWDAQERFLITGSNNTNQKMIWELDNPQQPLFTFTNAENTAWNQDGSKLLTSSFWHSSGPIQIWDPTTLTSSSLPLLTLPEDAYYAEWSPDGSRITTWQRNSDAIIAKIWLIEGTDAPQLEKTFSTVASHESLTWSDDGSKVLSHDEEGSIELWHTTDFSQPIVTWPITAATVSGNADLSRVLTEHSSEITLWNSADLSAPLFHSDQRFGTHFWNKDKSQFYFMEGTFDLLSVFVMDSETGSLIKELPGGQNANWSAANIFWVENISRRVYYDATNWNMITSVSFDSDVELTEDGSGAIRNPDGTIQFVGIEHTDTPLAFLPDQDWVGWDNTEQYLITWKATQEDDFTRYGTVEVWRDDNQTPLFSFNDVRFDNMLPTIQPQLYWLQNGRYLLVQKYDGVYLYPTTMDGWVRRACLVGARNLTWEEWQSYFPNEKYYHRTCEHLPVHPTVVDGFLRRFHTGIDNQLLMWRMVDEESVESLRDTMNERIDYIIESAIHEAQYAEALAIYETAVSFDPPIEVAPYVALELCLSGALFGEANDYIPVCDKAVLKQPNNAVYMIGRAIAHGFSGDAAGALADLTRTNCTYNYEDDSLNDMYSPVIDTRIFTVVIENHCQEWIDSLRKGNNPFTKEENRKLHGYYNLSSWEPIDPHEEFVIE